MKFTEIDREDFLCLLAEIQATHMPFGKFGKDRFPPRGVPMYDLPEEYLMWFKQRSFPGGRLGELMAHVCEIKECGMDPLFDPMRRAGGGRTKPWASDFMIQPSTKRQASSRSPSPKPLDLRNGL